MNKNLFIIAYIFISACSYPQYYTQSSEQFALATANFSDAYQDYATELYYIRPAMEIEELTLNPDKKLDGTSIKIIREQRGFEKNKINYDKKQLNLRLALADSLKNFSKILLEVTQTDIGSDFVTSVSDFNASFQSLASITHDDKYYGTLSPKIKERSDALTGVIATFGQAYIEEKQAKKLRHIILETSDLMTDILEKMKKDVHLFELASSVIRDERFFNVTKAYKKAQSQDKIFPFVHQFYAEKLQQQFAVLRATETIPNDIKSLLTALQKAHKELVRLAQTDKKIENTSELLSATQDINLLSAKIKTAIQSFH